MESPSISYLIVQADVAKLCMSAFLITGNKTVENINLHCSIMHYNYIYLFYCAIFYKQWVRNKINMLRDSHSRREVSLSVKINEIVDTNYRDSCKCEWIFIRAFIELVATTVFANGVFSTRSIILRITLGAFLMVVKLMRTNWLSSSIKYEHTQIGYNFTSQSL